MPTAPIQLHTPDDISRCLAERIRGLRLRAGWKQSTLAERSGVSVATVRRFEHSGRTSLDNLLALCYALGRIDDFSKLLEPPAARSLAELEARDSQPRRRRGSV